MQGDRFISRRDEEDSASLFNKKVELFSSLFNTPKKASRADQEEMDNENNQDQQPKEDARQLEEENKKTYRALLQNQVLGIQNEHLLNEINNSEDFMEQENLYSAMQQNAENMDAAGEGLMGSPTQQRNQNSPGSPLQYRVTHNNLKGQSSAEFSGQSYSKNGFDVSPFNSKFTVLKFSQKKKQLSNGKPKTAALRPFELSPEDSQSTPPKGSPGVLSRSKKGNFKKQRSMIAEKKSANQLLKSHFPYSKFSADKIPSELRSSQNLSENLDPIHEDSFCQNMFMRKPFCGFDSESVIVPKTKQRQISKIPYKVLDAPHLKDDYYLNLVDWSDKNDLVVGLQNCVYIWSATSSKVTKLHDLGVDDEVTSVNWARRGTHLSVGTDSGLVQVWDVVQQKMIREYSGHQGRVGSLSWSSNILSSGSKDRQIHNYDLRVKDECISRLIGHKQEVCGLSWSHDDLQLASGGNDNKLMIWSAHSLQSSEPQWKFNSHKAAVKALAWSPHQKGLLASGGGTADRCIRFWNTTHGVELQSVQTDSQVCSLVFSRNSNELVSTHGYSENAIVVWKYPSMRKLTTLTGHNLRVLYLAMSPDGESIVTGAGDETLRFWKVFPKAAKIKTQNSLIEASACIIR